LESVLLHYSSTSDFLHKSPSLTVFIVLTVVLLLGLLLHDVEVVPVSAPHGEHGAVLHDDAEGGGQGDLHGGHERARPAVPVHVELLDVAEDVHVEAHASDEAEQQVHHRGDAHGPDLGQDDVGGSEGHGQPRRQRDRQDELGLERDEGGLADHVDALHPTLALLEKVSECERGFLVHFSFDEIEAVSAVQSHDPEETVLGFGTFWAPVEGDFSALPRRCRRRKILSSRRAVC